MKSFKQKHQIGVYSGAQIYQLKNLHYFNIYIYVYIVVIIGARQNNMFVANQR